jgi:tetratricopeptide (TPR) repeat protein
MKSKFLEIYTYITNAYLTLIDPEQKRAYDKCIYSATLPPRKSMGQETEYPIFEKDIASRVYHRCLHLNQSRVAKNYELAVSKYNEGKDEFRKKNYMEAAHLFAMAIYFDSSVAGFHYHYGCALVKIEKLRDAVKALNRALELKPRDTDILAKLGHVYLKLGFPLRAKDYFEKAIKRSPGHKKAKEGLEILKNI